jgi:hypothetical protein
LRRGFASARRIDRILQHPLIGNAPDGAPFVAAGTYANGFRSTAGTSLIDGFIKIEMQDQAGNWQDVTGEILGLGIAGRDLTSPNPLCANQPNAIVRLQRLQDAPTAPAFKGAAT